MDTFAIRCVSPFPSSLLSVEDKAILGLQNKADERISISPIGSYGH
jgi:hypothetical protein